MQNNSQELKALHNKLDALVAEALEQAPDDVLEQGAIEVKIELVQPDGRQYLPDGHRYTEALRCSQREIDIIAAEDAQHQEFHKRTGIAANAAARKALTLIFADPLRPIAPKTIAKLWNDGVLVFDDGALRISHRFLRSMWAIGVLMLFMLLTIVFLTAVGWISAPRENHQVIIGAPVLLVLIVLAFGWVWHEMCLPYIRAKRIAPALERLFPSQESDAVLVDVMSQNSAALLPESGTFACYETQGQ